VVVVVASLLLGQVDNEHIVDLEPGDVLEVVASFVVEDAYILEVVAVEAYSLEASLGDVLRHCVVVVHLHDHCHCDYCLRKL